MYFAGRPNTLTKGAKTREALIQCVDLRADNKIWRGASSKNNSRILAIVTREPVAREACHHKACYRDYTRNCKELLAVGMGKRKICLKYTNAESQAYEMLFTYIKTYLLQNPRIVRMAELYTMFTSFFNSQGTEIKAFTRTHFWRKLEGQFRDILILKTFLATNEFLLIRLVFPD